MRSSGFVALLATLLSAPPVSADGATVFVRVTGTLRGDYQKGWKQSFEEKGVEIGTGSGFVISPHGQILTNHHVVSGREFAVQVAGTEVVVTLEVDRVEVGLPGGPGEAPQRFVASVDAVDADLDLALLSISGARLPHFRLGDSNALQPGQPVEVRGYPFGRSVEVGRASLDDIVPEVSVSPGFVAALRDGEDGRPAFVQTDATVNPGNSGGPLLDADGYVMGVVRMKLADTSGVGFAIPVDRVKDFLEYHGAAGGLPSQRLELGPSERYGWKGLTIRLPVGVRDVSPARTQLSSGPGLERMDLVVDRVATPLGLDALEQMLLAEGGWQPVSRARSTSGRADRRLGVASGSSVAADGSPLAMEYILVDLGAEALVGRYVGSRDEVAFSRGAIRGSLASLEAEPLLSGELRAPLPGELEYVQLPSGGPAVPLPAGWVREATAPAGCAGLRPAESWISASPEGDFTVAFRVAWWREPELVAEQGAAACAGRGTQRAGIYATGEDRLGVAYEVLGSFVQLGEGLLRLEAEVPAAKRRLVEPLFGAWVAAATDH